MMIDQFSKWMKMAAIPEQSALLTAKKILVHFIATFGCPLEIHTDQGRNFESKFSSILMS
jgi:transposase InsO family protein